jgi:hypothetical protein
LINWLFSHIIIFEEVFYFNFHFSPPSNFLSLPHQPRSHTHHAPIIFNFICHLLISRKSQGFDSTQLHLLKKKKKSTHSFQASRIHSKLLSQFFLPSKVPPPGPLIFSFFIFYFFLNTQIFIESVVLLLSCPYLFYFSLQPYTFPRGRLNVFLGP